MTTTTSPASETPTPDIPLSDQPHPDENMEPKYKIIPLVFNESMDATNKHNVLLIDSSVLDSQLFYDSANQDTYPIMYSTSSTKEELQQLLNDKFPNGFNRLSIVFHDPGCNLYKIFLNNKGLFEESDLLENATTFSENTAFLIDLLKNKNVLKIDFLACNTLNYPIWKQFYEMLHIETNVIVGASDDNTGNVKYGADWLMESTYEDIKTVYFNETIENYASTLAETAISSSDTIFIRQLTTSSNLDYSTDNQNTWTSVQSNYPIAITNSNPTTNLNVKFTTNITISATIGSTNGYFYPTTPNITFDGLKSDNARCIITIESVTSYPGFFRNGTTNNNGNSNVTVQNFNITQTSSTLLSVSNNRNGWLCSSNFSKGVANNLIKNCTNSGAISGQSVGGIVGGNAGCYNGFATITNCSNSGAISGSYAGGVVGWQSGYNNGAATITNCTNSGAISGSYAGGVVGGNAGYNNGTATITNCTNSGAISGQGVGGITGNWFGLNTTKTCSITNSYNIGNISGTNAGGICGGEVGYSTSYIATINIANCYSRGSIASTCGGLLGGTLTNTYSTTPTVTISNCYSSGGIASGGEGLIAPSLQIKNNITKTYCYIGNGSWLDSEANTALLNFPTDIYTQGTVWTKLAGTNVPYVLSAFNSDIYTIKLDSSVDVKTRAYSSLAGLFDASYNINSIKYNTTIQYSNTNNYIEIHNNTGVLTFKTGLSNGKYVVNVFAAKYTNGIPYSYNYNTFTINELSCFNHDTKILCLNDQSEEVYIPIQDLRKGHLVKTYLQGYKKIQCIGNGDMINDPTDWKKCMFKMEQNKENELIEDLIVTGWHGVLVDNLDPKEEEFHQKVHFSQTIDDKKILLASASTNFKALNNENRYTFYNFALEDDGDETKRFGVYANGLLVEIPSKKIFLSKYYDEM
jgi:hypothetical protein